MKRFVLPFLVCACVLLGTRSLYAQYGTVTTIAGNGYGGGYDGYGDGLHADSATFSNIGGFWRSRSTGNMYVADTWNNIVRKIDASTGIITSIAGTGGYGYTGDNGPAVLATLSDPGNLSADSAENVFFIDQGNIIRRIDNLSGIITTAAGGGSSQTDGIPATTANLDGLNCIYVDASGTIYCGFNNKVKKIDAGTGIITTIAGTSTAGYSGDNGPATSAELASILSISKDASGNIYVLGHNNGRIRKIDVSGIITTIAGNGMPPPDPSPFTNNGSDDWSLHTGDGGPATNARIYASKIALDSTGNIFCNSSGIIRKIDIVSGIITRVSASGWAGDISLDDSGNIYCVDGNNDYIKKFTSPTTGITALSASNSTSTPACTFPATVNFGLQGTGTTIPGATDSVHLSVDYRDGTPTQQLNVGYISTYGFGSSTPDLFSHTFTCPGNFTPVVTLTTADGFSDQLFMPEIFVGSACDSAITSIAITNTADTLITSACAAPAIIKFVVDGNITGTPPANDSAYILMKINTGPSDSTAMFATPYIYDGTNYNFSLTVNWPLYASTSFPYFQVMAVTSSGRHRQESEFNDDYQYQVTTPCGTPFIVANIGDSTNNDSYCSLPFTNQYTVSGWLGDSAALSTSLTVTVNFGDGTDTTVTATTSTDGYGNYTFSSPNFNHTLTMPGSCQATITGASFPISSGTTTSDLLTLGSSCSPVTGTFFVDANSNCTHDAGEVILGYWPYSLTNNTTGETTTGWCDENGFYSLQLIDGDNYTLVADPFGYSASSNLMFSCPASGSITVTSTPGSSVVADFAFVDTGSAPTEVDMTVSGWGWGFVPGDTGVVAVWSSDLWGYTGAALTSTITLTLDPLLTYTGMWDGPAPTTISGNTLTWDFSTVNDLFDFTAHVKAVTATTSTLGDNVCNTLSVTPTSITDPNLANNSYAWCEAVNSSWDPNEIEVSPKGYGAQGYIPNSTPLGYMIHFQNTGTAPAHNIIVIDTLSSALDISTLQIVSASSPVLLQQPEQTTQQIVKFIFSGINLPDSTTDPDGSIGYVAFNILPHDNLPGGTQITNYADIYFDYNAAVVTNSTINTIEYTLGNTAGPDSLCAGSSIMLSNELQGGVWSSANGAATVNTSGQVTGVSAGADTISYTVYGDQSTQKIISVQGTPVAATIAGADTVCLGATITLNPSVTGGTWQAGNANAFVTGNVVTGVGPGLCTLTYTLSNECGSTPSSKNIFIKNCPTGFEEVTANTGVQVFPNPANETLIINIISGIYTNYTITNSIGETVAQSVIDKAHTTVDVRALAAGMYYISIYGGDGTVVRKFVKL